MGRVLTERKELLPLDESRLEEDDSLRLPSRPETPSARLPRRLEHGESHRLCSLPAPMSSVPLAIQGIHLVRPISVGEDTNTLPRDPELASVENDGRDTSLDESVVDGGFRDGVLGERGREVHVVRRRVDESNGDGEVRSSGELECDRGLVAVGGFVGGSPGVVVGRESSAAGEGLDGDDDGQVSIVFTSRSALLQLPV